MARQLIEDPKTVMNIIPEARQLQDMYEITRPTEELSPKAPTPPITAQEEYR